MEGALEHQDFNKMARWSRDITITEKIDGTNSQVAIFTDAEVDKAKFDFANTAGGKHFLPPLCSIGGLNIYAGSRNGWLLPHGAHDHHGFAQWVWENRFDLVDLGPGRHFGEWWGSGINRGYDLKNGEKFFSLFNVSRWDPMDALISKTPPSCCSVVPILYRGPNTEDAILRSLEVLQQQGSYAAPGFMRPEGIVIFHEAANKLFKKTLERDEEPKGKHQAAKAA
jgi:hypothetical protein